MRCQLASFLLLVVSCAGCAQQGITGIVAMRAGNQLPAPGEKPAAAKPLKTEVVVYELTNHQQASFRAGVFHDVKTRMIAQSRSKRNGRFRIALPPGRYSVFVNEPDGLYANLWDAEMNIQPVTVVAGKFSEVKVEITRNATF